MAHAIKKYILVTKPGIVLGNLITAAGGYFLAARGSVDFSLLMSTVIGISLVVASACVLNNYVDRNMDRKMIRTRDRILARGLMSAKAAGFCAALLGAAGTALLCAAANMLAVAVVLAGFAIYAGVYSLVLKRSSVYAVLIGSLAGATPPLAGYCAVSGRFDMGALILLSIFSLWQIPHAYAIAIFRFDDYAAAAIPVLPVKAGLLIVKKQIIVYILAFLAATLTLTLGGYTGYSYLAAATAVGSIWLIMALSGFRTSDDRLWAKKMFVFSVLTIFVLTVMMSIDFTVPDTADTLLTDAGSPSQPTMALLPPRYPVSEKQVPIFSEPAWNPSCFDSFTAGIRGSGPSPLTTETTASSGCWTKRWRLAFRQPDGQVTKAENIHQPSSDSETDSETDSRTHRDPPRFFYQHQSKGEPSWQQSVFSGQALGGFPWPWRCGSRPAGKIRSRCCAIWTGTSSFLQTPGWLWDGASPGKSRSPWGRCSQNAVSNSPRWGPRRSSPTKTALSSPTAMPSSTISW